MGRMRSTWIDAGLKALAAGGPDAVRVEALARDLGVTKGGFYWHFDDRRALLEAMLDTWEQSSLTDVVAGIEAAGGDARTRLRRLFSVAAEHPELLDADLAVRDWARRDEAVAARLTRVDNGRLAYMRTLFGEFVDDPDDVEARCLIVACVWIGSHFIAAEHDGRSRGDVVARALRHVLT